jgi:hypothetical protein
VCNSPLSAPPATRSTASATARMLTRRRTGWIPRLRRRMSRLGPVRRGFQVWCGETFAVGAAILV